jgi:hypothetical protein
MSLAVSMRPSGGLLPGLRMRTLWVMSSLSRAFMLFLIRTITKTEPECTTVHAIVYHTRSSNTNQYYTENPSTLVLSKHGALFMPTMNNAA